MAALIFFRSMLFFHHPKDSIDFTVGLSVTCNESCSHMSESIGWTMFEQTFVNPCVWGVGSGVMFQKIIVWPFHLFPLKLQHIYFFYHYMFCTYGGMRNSLLWVVIPILVFDNIWIFSNICLYVILLQNYRINCII